MGMPLPPALTHAADLSTANHMQAVALPTQLHCHLCSRHLALWLRYQCPTGRIQGCQLQPCCNWDRGCLEGHEELCSRIETCDMYFG
jgi:hypothetical protein